MKKFLLFIICLYSAQSLACHKCCNLPENPSQCKPCGPCNKPPVVEFKKEEHLNHCKITKSAMNDCEPEEFQPSNNLLRKPGQSTVLYGKRIVIKGKLLDQNCIPISDAKIYLWQVGHDGKYPYVPLRSICKGKICDNRTFTGSGIATTNNKGEFYFVTVYPGGSRKTGNVNIRVEHRDLGKLQTKLFLTNSHINRKNCGEINHALRNVVENFTIYDFDIVMPGRTLRRY
ncbi:MAG: dioxygenase [Candidatus Rickettsia vulgarisii]